jgi:hypothetical protein
LQELSTISSASIYNQVYHLQKPDYSQDVTEASNNAYVFVLLTSSQGTNEESKLLIEIWRELARQFGDVKFCQIQADLCIEGYPDRNTPTVLVYKDGDIRKQLVTLRELNGPKTTIHGKSLALLAQLSSYSTAKHRTWLLMDGFADLRKVLVEIGAVAVSDPRMRGEQSSTYADTASRNPGSTLRGSSRDDAGDDDDSDWD